MLIPASYSLALADPIAKIAGQCCQHSVEPRVITQSTIFRCLVVASFVVGAVYGYGFTKIEYPASWHEPIDPRDLVIHMIGPILALINLIAYVGLLFFWRPARILLVVYLLGVMGPPFIDMPQMPGWLQALHRLDLILQGVLLASMFLPPYSGLFAKARSSSTAETAAQRTARGSL